MNIFRFKNILLCLTLAIAGVALANDAAAPKIALEHDAPISTVRSIQEPIVAKILEKVPEKKRPSQLATMFNHYWATHASVIKDWYVGSHKRTLTPDEAQIQSLIEEITLKEWTFEAFNRDPEASVPFVAASVNLFDAVDAQQKPAFRTAFTTGMLDIFALNTATNKKLAPATMNRLVKNLRENPNAETYAEDINKLAAGLPEFKLDELPWLNARKAAAIAGAIVVTAVTAFGGKKLRDYRNSTPGTPPGPTPPGTPPPGTPTPTPATPSAPAPTPRRLSPSEERAQTSWWKTKKAPTFVERAFNAINSSNPDAIVERIGDEFREAAHVAEDLTVRGQNALITFVSEPDRVISAAKTGGRWTWKLAPYYLTHSILGWPGVILTCVGDAMSAARERIIDPVAPAAADPTATAQHTALVAQNNQRRTYLGLGALAVDKTRIVSTAITGGYLVVNTLPWVASYVTGGSDVAYWLTLATEVAVPAVAAWKYSGSLSAVKDWISARSIGGYTVGGFCTNVWNRLCSLNPNNLAATPVPGTPAIPGGGFTPPAP